MINSDERKIIKHKGMPFYKSPMSKGHLVVTFDIEYPQPGEISDKEYARLAILLNQTIPKAMVTQNVRTLEHYEDPRAHHEEEEDHGDEEEQGGVRCQNQ